MTGKAVRFHPEAEQEYLAALSWYRERSLIAATNVENAVSAALETIAEAPQRWPIYFEKFRKYSLRQFPFSIVYQELSSELIVLASHMGTVSPATGKSGTGSGVDTSRGAAGDGMSFACSESHRRGQVDY